jgi:arylsulfatase A-like enzyme
VQAVPPLDASAVETITARYRLMRATLLAVDDMIGAVLKALTAAGKLDNTIVVFTSDNGYLHGQHRLVGKFNEYEQSIQVPLIIRGPGIPESQARRQLVNNLDLAATIVAAAGATPDHALDGHDLSSVLSDRNAPWRTALLVRGGWYFAVRTGRYLYAQHETRAYGSEEELYDLKSNIDPDQMTNFAGVPQYRRILAELESILETLKTCSGDSCWYTAPIKPRHTREQATGQASPVTRGPIRMFGTRHAYDVLQAASEASPVAAAGDR